MPLNFHRIVGAAARWTGRGCLLGIVAAVGLGPLRGEETVPPIPAFTAYSIPNPRGIDIAPEHGATGWGPENRLAWYGYFAQPGKLEASLEVICPEGSPLPLQWRLGSQLAEATGITTTGKTRLQAFRPLAIDKPGYHCLEFQLLAELKPSLKIVNLQLRGEACRGAHFNREPRRNAASVHLLYPVEPTWKLDRFSAEVTGLEDPPATFYMACGFHRGYLGMQVISPTERRIIFSVWDAGRGQQADRREQVDRADYVELLEKGDGVVAHVFGGEGTGGHSHWVYPWETGKPQRFQVTAEPDGTATIFSGYYWQAEHETWKLIARMKAPAADGYLHGLHSFSENFDGATGHRLRKARFGSGWIHTADGRWLELRQATFSHDPTGKTHRRDRWMGLDADQFFLAHGGFGAGFTDYGASYERPISPLPASLEYWTKPHPLR
jgi:hypothetical protein